MTDIRVATTQDIELINSLARETFSYTYCEILSTEQLDYMFDMMYSPINIQKQMDAGHLYHIISLDAKPCGYLSIRAKGPQHFYIEKIYTIPSVHGSGVGRALFEYACEYALQNCHAQECLLELNVNRNNERAIKFYTKMGMRKDRRTDEHVGGGYYANDFVMAINLVKQLSARQ